MKKSLGFLLCLMIEKMMFFMQKWLKSDKQFGAKWILVSNIENMHFRGLHHPLKLFNWYPKAVFKKREIVSTLVILVSLYWALLS